MNVPKGPTVIVGAYAKSDSKVTLGDRILNLLKDNKEKGLSTDSIVKVLGFGRSSISSTLSLLAKKKLVHKRKKPGSRACTYYLGEEGSNSPNIASINQVIDGLSVQIRDMTHQVSQVKGCLKVVREHALRLERIRDEKDEKMMKMEKDYKELETDHLALLEKLEGLIK